MEGSALGVDTTSRFLGEVEGRQVGRRIGVSMELEYTAPTTEPSLTIIGGEGERPPGGDGGIAMKMEGAALQLETMSRFLGREGGDLLGRVGEERRQEDDAMAEEGVDLRCESASSCVGKEEGEDGCSMELEVADLAVIQRTNSSSPDCSQITMVFIADFNSEVTKGKWDSGGCVTRSRG